VTPQQKRVLAAAKSFRGTCSADWIDGLGADGKGKISRVPARIEELAEEYGYCFEHIGWRHKTKVFRVVEVEGSAGEQRGEMARRPEAAGSCDSPAGVSAPLSPEPLFKVGKAELGYADQGELDAA
jgi:hypothetical protein